MNKTFQYDMSPARPQLMYHELCASNAMHNAIPPTKHCTNVISWFNIDMGRFMTILERYFSTSREIPMHVCSARCPGGGGVQCTLYLHLCSARHQSWNLPSRRQKFHKSQSQRREKAPARASSWLKALTSAFTFKTLMRHRGLMPVQHSENGIRRF